MNDLLDQPEASNRTCERCIDPREGLYGFLRSPLGKTVKIILTKVVNMSDEIYLASIEIETISCYNNSNAEKYQHLGNIIPT